MEKYQLYELLGALSSGEIRKIRWFLTSGYATKREELHLMLGYLVERKAAKRPWPELKLLYKHAFPGQPYDNQQLRNAMSELHALLEDFLLMEETRISSFVIDSKFIIPRCSIPVPPLGPLRDDPMPTIV